MVHFRILAMKNENVEITYILAPTLRELLLFIKSKYDLDFIFDSIDDAEIILF